jgi:hypothetical protein
MQVITKQQIEKCFLHHCHCITYELLNSKQKQPPGRLATNLSQLIMVQSGHAIPVKEVPENESKALEL